MSRRLGHLLWKPCPVLLFTLGIWEFCRGENDLGPFAMATSMFLLQLAPWFSPATRFWKLFLPTATVTILASSLLLVWASHHLPAFDSSKLTPLSMLMMFVFCGIEWRRERALRAKKPVLPEL